MRQGHIPFGYRIEDGRAKVNEQEAGQLRKMFAEYLAGLSYEEAAKTSGLVLTHSAVKGLLQNRHYLGDEFYPALVDQETFDAAEAERVIRAERLGRGRKKNAEGKPRRVNWHFSIGKAVEKWKDPFEQAAYIYSLIESEEQYGNSNDDTSEQESRMQDSEE